MPSERDAANAIADQLIGRGQIANAAAAAAFRAALVTQLTKLYRRGLPDAQLISEAVRVADRLIKSHAKVAAGLLTDLKLAGFVHGANAINGKLRPELLRRIQQGAAIAGQPPPAPPALPSVYPPGDEGPTIRLPKLEQAARDLAERRLVSPEEFYDLSGRYRRQSTFTVSRFEADAVERIRSALVDTTAEGPSIEAFAERLDAAAMTSPLGPGHLDNVFRTNTVAAFAAGEDRLLGNPVIGDTFPYSKRLPIRDGRLTELCAIIARSGIDGTAIYRRDDPVYRAFRRPSHFQCRCAEVYLTAREAARQGILEAQQYVDTGTWPTHKAFVPFPSLTAEARATWDSWTKYRGSRERAA